MILRPLASELRKEAKSQTDVFLAAGNILAFLTSLYSSRLKKNEFSQKITKTFFFKRCKVKILNFLQCVNLAPQLLD